MSWLQQMLCGYRWLYFSSGEFYVPIWVWQDHYCYIVMCCFVYLLFCIYYSALNFSKASFNLNLPDYQSHELIGICWISSFYIKLITQHVFTALWWHVYFLTFVSMGFGVWHMCFCCYFLFLKLLWHYYLLSWPYIQ